MADDICPSLAVSIGDRDIFSSSYWITLPPPFLPEFERWMRENFGPERGRWWAYAEYWKSVRSNRGAGNRGGWEKKPYIMAFYFLKDADAIIFKMKWHENIRGHDPELTLTRS